MRTPQSTPPPKHLAGNLLLAHPAMRDPNFRRTVVLVSMHGDEGAMGVVLNRPLGKRLGELNGAFAYGPLAEVPVFAGGPVQLEQLIMVGWQRRDDGFRLHFGVEPDLATELVGQENTVLRAFAGFSGWSSGQLENELKENTWIVRPMPPDLMDADVGVAQWRKLLGELSPEWQLLANEPEDPTAN
jgi:putative transcriptional regulator